MAAQREIVILGAGHNALVAAFYLAKKGLKPLVLERREVVGGAAVTEEFHPGFRCSTVAHAGGPPLGAILKDMQLARHGLEKLESPVRIFAPTLEGRALTLYTDTQKSVADIEKFSAKDAVSYGEFAAGLARVGTIIEQLLLLTPPVIEKPSKEDIWKLLRVGRRVRGLGKKEMMRLIRWGPMAVADFVAEFFETELIRATIAARGIFGTALGPWSAGSTAVLLLRAAADPHPVGSAAFPRGGLGSLTRALADAARKAGVEIRTQAEVEHIRVKNGGVSSVVLADGEEIPTEAVVSGVDPKRTFFNLVDPSQLDPTFALRIRNIRASGNVAKVNFALDDLPAFPALADAVGADGARQALSGRIHIGHEIDYLERAFDASKYGEFSAAPHLDVTIPTLLDPSLAPEGKHVLSAYVQFAPYKLKEGTWNSRRKQLGDAVIKTLSVHSPKLADLIESTQVITPQDLETTYGFTGGHVFHGELALDQLFTMRPVLDWARYKTPIRGLFLCGSGTHPGNGLTGASGANAAGEIIHDLR